MACASKLMNLILISPAHAHVVVRFLMLPFKLTRTSSWLPYILYTYLVFCFTVSCMKRYLVYFFVYFIFLYKFLNNFKTVFRRFIRAQNIHANDFLLLSATDLYVVWVGKQYAWPFDFQWLIVYAGYHRSKIQIQKMDTCFAWAIWGIVNHLKVYSNFS